jgi:hypothetical protein
MAVEGGGGLVICLPSGGAKAVTMARIVWEAQEKINLKII